MADERTMSPNQFRNAVTQIKERERGRGGETAKKEALVLALDLLEAQGYSAGVNLLREWWDLG